MWLPVPAQALPPPRAVPPSSPEGLHEVEVGKLMAVHEGLEDLQVEGIPAGDREEGTRAWHTRLLAPASWVGVGGKG